VFAPEIAALPAGERREVLQALNVATAWTAWETLRAHNGLSESEARKVMARMVRALLQKED